MEISKACLCGLGVPRKPLFGHTRIQERYRGSWWRSATAPHHEDLFRLIDRSMGRGGNRGEQGNTTFFFGQEDYPVQDIVFRAKPKRECQWGDRVPDLAITSIISPLASDPLGKIVLKKVLAEESTPSKTASHDKIAERLRNQKGLTPRSMRVKLLERKEDVRALHDLKKNRVNNPSPSDEIGVVPFLVKNHLPEAEKLARKLSVACSLSSRSTSRASTVINIAPETVVEASSEYENSRSAGAAVATEKDAAKISSQSRETGETSYGAAPDEKESAMVPRFQNEQPKDAAPENPGISNTALCDKIAELRAKGLQAATQSTFHSEADLSSRALRTKLREEQRLQTCGRLASDHFSEGDVSHANAKAMWCKVRAAVQSGSFFEHFESELHRSQSMVEQFYQENSAFLPGPPSAPKPKERSRPRLRRPMGLQVTPAAPTESTPKHLKIKRIQAVVGSPTNAAEAKKPTWYLPGVGQKNVEFHEGKVKRVLEDPPSHSSKRRASQDMVALQADESYTRAEVEVPKTPSARKTRLRALREVAHDPREAIALPRTPSPEPRNTLRYQGESKDGVPHGTGRYDGLDGSRYEGEWWRGLMHGFGTLRFGNGDTYTGEWRHGYRHGQGRSETTSGEGYDGEWYVGMQHGQGRHWTCAGEEYVGEWRENAPHGQGTFREKNGDRWEGVWKGGSVEWQSLPRRGASRLETEPPSGLGRTLPGRSPSPTESDDGAKSPLAVKLPPLAKRDAPV